MLSKLSKATKVTPKGTRHHLKGLLLAEYSTMYTLVITTLTMT